MRRFRLLSLVAMLLLSTIGAFAHAHLKSATPAANATVAPDTASVTLHFSEAVHTGMSQFKVYPLKDASSADSASTAALSGQDPAPRVDNEVTPHGPSSESVKVALKTPLKAGTYLVVWKVMAADDGHITSGHYVFQVKTK